MGLGGNRQVAIVAIGHEAIRELSRQAELFVEGAGEQRHRARFLVGAEVADARAEMQLRVLGLPGDEVDCASHSVRPIECGAGSPQDLDAL